MRAMWSGAVSFGLVSVPVKAYAATTNHDIRFHQVHSSDGGRIKYKRTCSLDGQEVEYADIVKGYETEEGELITLSEEDLDSLPTATGHEIDVVEFVPADQIDPLLFDKSYYLEPDAEGGEAVRAAARGAGADRPDGRGQGGAAPARDDGAAAGARQGDRAADDAVAGRGARTRLRDPRRRRRPAPAGAEDGRVAGGEPGRRLRRQRLPRRVPRRRRGPDRAEEDHGRRASGAGGSRTRGRRGRQHDGPAHGPAAQRRGGEGGVRPR